MSQRAYVCCDVCHRTELPGSELFIDGGSPALFFKVAVGLSSGDACSVECAMIWTARHLEAFAGLPTVDRRRLPPLCAVP